MLFIFSNFLPVFER
jgi:hypothetical protein